MTITNTEFYQLVGEELEIIDGEQSLSANDAARIARYATKARAWLLEDGKVYWADNAIPDSVALPFAMIVAGRVASKYGRGPASSYPYADGPEGYRLLCENVSNRSANEPVKSEYF